MATGWALQLWPSHPDAVAFSITPDAFSSFYLGRKPSPRTRAGVLAPKLSSTRTGSPSRECSRGWGRGAFGDRPRIRTGRAVSGSSIWNSPTMTRTQSGEGGEAASACCSEGHHVLKSWIRARRPAHRSTLGLRVRSCVGQGRPRAPIGGGERLRVLLEACPAPCGWLDGTLLCPQHLVPPVAPCPVALCPRALGPCPLDRSVDLHPSELSEDFRVLLKVSVTSGCAGLCPHRANQPLLGKEAVHRREVTTPGAPLPTRTAAE